MRQEKSSLLRNKGFQSLLASLLCIVLGLLIGYIVLLIINPAGAGEVPVLSQRRGPAAVSGQHAGEDRAAADVQPVGAVRL